MKTIWKFPLQVTDEQYVEMPMFTQVPDVQVQDGIPCLWALVDPAYQKSPKKIITHGTGHDVPVTTGNYIATYQLSSGLVFHVFEDA